MRFLHISEMRNLWRGGVCATYRIKFFKLQLKLKVIDLVEVFLSDDFFTSKCFTLPPLIKLLYSYSCSFNVSYVK